MIISAAADIPVNRADEAQVKAMDDPSSFAAEAVRRVQGLVEKSKKALLNIGRLMRMPQDKTLDELAEAFVVEGASQIEVLKRTSRILGALFAFQLLMGYGIQAEFEDMLRDIPRSDDGTEVDLAQFTARARDCARQLIELVEANKAKRTGKDAPSASAQTNAP